MSGARKCISDYAGKVVGLYVDGFRNMTVGKKLWAIIIVKVIVLFLVLRLFFFPDILSERYDSDRQRSDAVREIMINRQM